MSEPTPAQIEADIIASITVISELWGRMLDRKSTGSVASRTVKSGETWGEADDNSDGDHGVTRTDAIISTRGDITAVLNGWCRVVIDDFGITKTIPHGHDVAGMCAFLIRWARSMSGHVAAQDMADELGECRTKVLRIVRPVRRDWVWIGDCPVTLAHEGEQVVCGRPIRVWSGRPIRCKGCGTEDTLDGWILKIVGERPLVTAEQLIPLLHKRLGIVATQAQIRQWVARQVIVVVDHRRIGRSDVALFDQFDVLARLSYRRSA